MWGGRHINMLFLRLLQVKFHASFTVAYSKASIRKRSGLCKPRAPRTKALALGSASWLLGVRGLLGVYTTVPGNTWNCPRTCNFLSLLSGRTALFWNPFSHRHLIELDLGENPQMYRPQRGMTWFGHDLWRVGEQNITLLEERLSYAFFSDILKIYLWQAHQKYRISSFSTAYNRTLLFGFLRVFSPSFLLDQTSQK